MASQSYWKKASEEVATNQFEKGIALDKRLLKEYTKAYEVIDKQLLTLLASMKSDLKNGELPATALYKGDRYTLMRDTIAKEMIRLGATEQTSLTMTLGEVFKSVRSETSAIIGSSFGFIPESQVESAIKVNWKGRNFSSSIWKDKDLLTKSLNKNITDSIISGKSNDQVVRAMRDSLDSGYSNTSRLVRTETNKIVNEGQMASYKQAGITHYKFLAEEDSRTSSICSELDGDIISFKDAELGVNFPPMHPNCRSTIIPIIED
jgi:SPP1 gp7 family putative phage head morphogenesis protein